MGAPFGCVAVSQGFPVNGAGPVWPLPSLLLIPCAYGIEVREKKKRLEACPVCANRKRCLALGEVVEASPLPARYLSSQPDGAAPSHP